MKKNFRIRNKDNDDGGKTTCRPPWGKAPSADVTTSKAPSRVSSLPVRASARLKRGQQHAISFSWSQEDCGHARRGDLPCLDLSTFFFSLVLDPDGSGMSDGRGQSSPCLGLRPATKSPPATFGRLGFTAWGSNAGAMDGDPRRLPASMRSPGAHSDRGERGFLTHIRACLDGQRWERSMGKTNESRAAPRRTGVVGQSDARPERVSRRLPSSLSFFSSSLLTLTPFPLSLGSRLSFALRSVDFIPTEPNSNDERPASTRPRWDAATATAQTPSISRPRPRHPQTASSPPSRDASETAAQ